MDYIFAVVVGAIVFFTYRQGLKDGMRKSENAPLEQLKAPRPKITKGDEDNAKIILANIEAYDGTTKNQTRVEV